MNDGPDRHDESPFNPMPPVVVALALLIFGAEIVFQLAARGIIGGAEGVGWRLTAIRDYSFSAVIFDWMVQTGRWPAEHLMRFVTYPFVHVSFTHALMVLVFLLALGKMVGDVFGTFAVLAIFFGSAVLGALGFALIVDSELPLVGGYPAVYGLIGAYTFMLWLSLKSTGGPQMRAFTLIGLLLAVQLVFGLLFGAAPDWVADLIGFVSGFCLTSLMVPGAWARILARLRQR